MVDDEKEPVQSPHAHVVYKPLRPEKDAEGGRAVEASPYLRAENEDDDGYDPYSDRREEAPLFEKNPWD